MKEEDYKQLQELLDEELQYDPTSVNSIRDRQGKIPQLLQQFLTIYANEKNTLLYMQSQLKITHNEFYHKYRHNCDKQGKPLVKFDFDFRLNTKNEVEEYVEGDENYAKKALSVEKQKLQVEFLDRSIQNIRDMSWALKTSFELFKYFEGQ